MVKNLPARPRTLVQFLDGEDLLEKRMATHSSTLAWEISWTEEPGSQIWVTIPLGHKELDTIEKLKLACSYLLA